MTGSEHLSITATTSQSLAGRSAPLHLLPLAWSEIRTTAHAGDDLFSTLWRGGYPAIFDRGIPPERWLAAYVRTYVERDVRQLLNIGDQAAFQTFTTLCAGRAGQQVNLSSLGADADISQPTARSWLSVLEASFLVFRLRPWHRNLGKQLVKTPKLYFHDTGLLCWLLGIRKPDHLATYPLRGAVFENWVVADVYKQLVNQAAPLGLWFYRDKRGNEVDLLLDRGVEVAGVEIKSGQTVASDFFETLDALRELWDAVRAAPHFRPILLHGGSTRERRTRGEVIGWRDVSALTAGA